MYNELHTIKAINLDCIWQDKIIFKQLAFEITAGDMLLIEGPNGSGKSSLLKLLAGLTTPNHGEIHWCGKSIQQIKIDFCETMHYVGHANGIKLGLTVMENLQLMQKLSLAPTLLKINDVLALLKLDKDKYNLTSSLSAGQKRRVALAKLWLVPKSIWILDEPLTALDLATQAIFLAELETHLSNHGIAIISSHHPLVFANQKLKKINLGEIC